MEQHQSESPPKRRVQKKSGIMIFFSIFLAFLGVIAIIYLLFPESIKQFLPVSSETLIAEQSLANFTSTTNKSTGQDQLQPSSTEIEVESGVSSAPLESQTTSDNKTISEDSKTDTACRQLAKNVELFFNTLDNRPYIHNFNIEEKSIVYFPQLIQKLADNPPVVTGETNDLFTILQNTAHFFRIIGKKNIIILKGILDREKVTFEQTFADFFQLTQHPDCLKERFDLSIGDETLYQYAGFFLNTMGGRLYLFRRDSMSRMIVNYYAIVIIDQANRQGKNHYGIQLDTAIDSLINDIESSSVNLQMRDIYLDSLYNMKEKYQ